MQVEREESDGDEVVVFRFEVEGGVDLAPLAAGRAELDRRGLLDWRAWPRSDMSPSVASRSAAGRPSPCRR